MMPLHIYSHVNYLFVHAAPFQTQEGAWQYHVQCLLEHSVLPQESYLLSLEYLFQYLEKEQWNKSDALTLKNCTTLLQLTNKG